MHYALMPPFGERFLPVWLIGLLVGATSLAQLSLDVPAGYLIDRFGYTRLLKISTAIFFSAALCIATGLTEVTYLVSNFLSTFGYLFFLPGINACLLSEANRSAEGRLFSLRDTFGSIGVVLCSVALSFVLLLSPSSAGILLCCTFFFAFIALFFMPEERLHTSIVRKSRVKRSIPALLGALRKLNPAGGILLLLTFSASTFYGVVWFVVPLVIATQEAAASVMSIGLGIFDFSVVVLGYVIGTLADRANRRQLIFFGLLLFSVMAMLAGMDFGWLFVLFGFIAAAGEEVAGISLWSWLHTLDTEHAADGTLAGTISLFDDLGWTVGPVIGGILFSIVGPSWAVTLGAVPIFFVWVIIFCQKREQSFH